MIDVEEIIRSFMAIFIVIILAIAFIDVINQVNPGLVAVFVGAIVLIILAIIKGLFK